ncbi:hypothetical protein U0070_017397, partial [Myodes glareolus]
QAPGRLSLRRAALLAPSSAGGPWGLGSLRPQLETKAGADPRPGGPRDLREGEVKALLSIHLLLMLP